MGGNEMQMFDRGVQNCASGRTQHGAPLTGGRIQGSNWRLDPQSLSYTLFLIGGVNLDFTASTVANMQFG